MVRSYEEDGKVVHAEHMPPSGLAHPRPESFEETWFLRKQYLPTCENEVPLPRPPEKVDRGVLATGGK